MTNPNNYPGATITLVGYAAGHAKAPAWDKGETSGVYELSIPVTEGYKKDGEWVETGTTWYTVSAVGAYADELKAIGKGDKVRIDNGKLEAREFERKDGTKGQQFTVKYGTVTILERSTREGGTVADAGYIPADDGSGF